MTWATIRALRQPSALSVAGLADLEAQLHLGLRLHALDPGARASVAVLDVVSRKWLATLARRHGLRHPDDEHEGRCEAICPRRDGLAQTRLGRFAYRRNTTSDREPSLAGYYKRALAH
jgi:hypothetical protein